MIRSVFPLLPILTVLFVVGGAMPEPSRAATARDRLVVGLKAFQDGFYGLAAKELRAYLEQVPDAPRREDVLWVLAQAEMEREDWAGAAWALEERRGVGGDAGRESVYWLGWVASRRGRPSEAARHFEEYLAEGGEPHRGDALLALARLRRSLGEPRRAAQALAAFLGEAGGDTRRATVWAERVEALGAAGEHQEAAEAALAATQDPAVTADPSRLAGLALSGAAAARAHGASALQARLWAVVARHAPEAEMRLRGWYEAGAAWAQADHPERAQEALGRYLDAAPRGYYAAGAHLILARLAAVRGDAKGELRHVEALLGFPEASEVGEKRMGLRKSAFSLSRRLGDDGAAERHGHALVENAAALSPEELGRVRMALAALAAGRGRSQEAITHWDAVPEASSAFPEARQRAAEALLEAHRPEEALARLDPLLTRGEPDPQVCLVALAAAEGAKRFDLAADLCQRLLRRRPEGLDAAGLLERRALHLKTLGDVEGYAATLQKLAVEFPQDRRAPWAASELQRLSFERADWEGVLRWAPLAKTAPDEGVAQYRQAEALRAVGRGDAARAALEEVAAEEGPYRSLALVRLGSMLDEGGETAAAIASYREALEAGLGGEPAEWVRQRLSELTRNRGDGVE